MNIHMSWTPLVINNCKLALISGCIYATVCHYVNRLDVFVILFSISMPCIAFNQGRKEIKLRQWWVSSTHDNSIPWVIFLHCWPSLSLQWRHNEHDGISNHQTHDCLLNHLFRCISKKTSQLHVTGLCAGNSPVTGEFPAQRASNA